MALVWLPDTEPPPDPLASLLATMNTLPSQLDPDQLLQWQQGIAAANRYNILCHCKVCDREWIASEQEFCGCGSQKLEYICWNRSVQVDGHGSNFWQFDFKSVDWIRLELRKYKRAVCSSHDRVCQQE